LTNSEKNAIIKAVNFTNPGGFIFTVKKVLVIMGSFNDINIVEGAFEQLKEFDIPFEAVVASAHRTPELSADIARNAKENDVGVIICCAGMAAHLAGVVAAHTILPVIGVPLKGSFEGLDALLATVQMPTGIPVATVAVNGTKNAAILAAQILAVSDSELEKKLTDYKIKMAENVLNKNKELQIKLKG
jgi:5-(carboxyamino)imidazole ribonucleotide mutase